MEFKDKTRNPLGYGQIGFAVPSILLPIVAGILLPFCVSTTSVTLHPTTLVHLSANNTTTVTSISWIHPLACSITSMILCLLANVVYLYSAFSTEQRETPERSSRQDSTYSGEGDGKEQGTIIYQNDSWFAVSGRGAYQRLRSLSTLQVGKDHLPVAYTIVSSIEQGVIFLTVATFVQITHLFSFVYLFLLAMVLRLWISIPVSSFSNPTLRVMGTTLLYMLLCSEPLTYATTPTIQAHTVGFTVSILLVTGVSLVCGGYSSTVSMLPVCSGIQVLLLVIALF
jgi:hypothetical protein